jgi:hypothetical protein
MKLYETKEARQCPVLGHVCQKVRYNPLSEASRDDLPGDFDQMTLEATW